MCADAYDAQNMGGKMISACGQAKQSVVKPPWYQKARGMVVLIDDRRSRKGANRHHSTKSTSAASAMFMMPIQSKFYRVDHQFMGYQRMRALLSTSVDLKNCRDRIPRSSIPRQTVQFHIEPHTPHTPHNPHTPHTPHMSHTPHTCRRKKRHEASCP